MRLLVLSDIHANRFSLEAVLQAAKGQYDQALCLGDVVGYGAHPNECCEILRDLQATCLMGNHDAAALGLISIEWFNEVAAYAVEWTRRNLDEENALWLRGLPPQRDWPEYSFHSVHASLRHPLEEYILSPDIAEPNLLQQEHSLCFFGHTHLAVCFSAPRERHVWKRWNQLQTDWLPLGGTIELKAEKKYLINPGSCGQPRDGNPQARYAIFDTLSRHLEVFAIDYPWQEAREAILQAGLPRALGDRLLVGQ